MSCTIILTKYKIVAPRVFCTSHLHLLSFLKEILKNEGEGVVLRKPKSFYEPGRSANLLKLKVIPLLLLLHLISPHSLSIHLNHLTTNSAYKASRGDREALVLDIESDGSMLLQLYVKCLSISCVLFNFSFFSFFVSLFLFSSYRPNGATFTVPPHQCSTFPLPIAGDIVSFSYENFARSAIPIKPKIFRIRKDVNWKDVVNSYNHDQKLNGMHQRSKTKVAQNYGKRKLNSC